MRFGFFIYFNHITNLNKRDKKFFGSNNIFAENSRKVYDNYLLQICYNYVKHLNCHKLACYTSLRHLRRILSVLHFAYTIASCIDMNFPDAILSLLGDSTRVSPQIFERRYWFLLEMISHFGPVITQGRQGGSSKYRRFNPWAFSLRRNRFLL